MSVGAVNKQTGDRIPTAGMPAIDDALDLTSVNPVQNAVITAALANKQDKTDNNLVTTAKTIVGAINEHEGDIDSLMSGLTNLDVALSVPEGTGKNILMNTKIPQSKTSDGVTLTALYDADGYWSGFSFTGTLTRPNYGFEFASYVLKAGTYTINSVLSRTDKKTAFLIYDANMEMIDNINNTTKLTSTFTISQDMTIRCFVFAYDEAGDYSGLIFRPMLRLASVSDPTYAPYIPSVESRIEAVESGLAGLTTEINKELMKSADNRAWSGSSLVFSGISAVNTTVWYFCAMTTTDADTTVQSGYIIVQNVNSVKVCGKTGTFTVAYDNSNNKLTITLPSTGYWVYRMYKAGSIDG